MTNPAVVSIGSPPAVRSRNSCARDDRMRFSSTQAIRPSVDGFSLIELLVVVVIIGVLALAVTLAMGDSAQRQLLREAERFQALVGQACERAELSGREIGVLIGERGYSFLILGGNDWNAMADEGPLRPRSWIDGLHADLSSEGRRVNLGSAADARPQLVCFSSGELTPFALTLVLGDAPHYRVSGSDDAMLKTERVESSR
jgi:general secretion pathway protein H